MKPLICIVGPTCSGKDTVAKVLQKRKKLKMVCSHTDRPMRDGELNGREHIFVSKEQMDRIFSDRQNIIAPTTLGGYRYCTLRSIIEEADLYLIDPTGVYELMEKIPDRTLLIIYIDAPEYEREERSMEHRSDYKAEFHKRNQSEQQEFPLFVSKMLQAQQTDPKIQFYYCNNRNRHQKETIRYVLNILS